jgi:hypothetical protein
MPRSKRSKAQIEQMKSVGHGWGSVATAPVSITELQDPATKELVEAQKKLQIAKEKTAVVKVQVAIAEKKAAKVYDTVRIVKRKLQRTVARKSKLEDQIALLQSVELPTAKGDAARAIQLFEGAQTDNADLKHKLSHLMERCATEAAQTAIVHSKLRTELVEIKQKN